MLNYTSKTTKIKIMKNIALKELDLNYSLWKISNWFLTSHEG